MKKIFIGSDTHCGHIVGLTHPDYQENGAYSETNERRKILWDWFSKEIKSLQPFDIAIWNGDLIDGHGTKQRGSDELTTNCEIQCDMATKVVNFVGGKRKIIVYGTLYHSGDNEDWEKIIGERVGCQQDDMGSHFDLNLTSEFEEKLILNIKHFIPNSNTYNGKANPLFKVIFNRVLNEYTGLYSKANIIIRSHIHKCIHVGDATTNTQCWTTPALQGYGAKYARQLEGLPVDFGFLVLYVNNPNDYHIEMHIMKPKFQGISIKNL